MYLDYKVNLICLHLCCGLERLFYIAKARLCGETIEVKINSSETVGMLNVEMSFFCPITGSSPLYLLGYQILTLLVQ